MLKRFILSVGLLFAAQGAVADSFWEHNGSLMRLSTDGSDRRIFTYEEPSDLMYRAGVRTGTVLFEGRRIGDEYVGTARVFSRNCGWLEYRVSGVVPNERTVILYGKRERYNSQTCRPTGSVAHDKLVFNYRYSE